MGMRCSSASNAASDLPSVLLDFFGICIDIAFLGLEMVEVDALPLVDEEVFDRFGLLELPLEDVLLEVSVFFILLLFSSAGLFSRFRFFPFPLGMDASSSNFDLVSLTLDTLVSSLILLACDFVISGSMESLV